MAHAPPPQLVLGFFRYHPAGPPHPLLLLWNLAHIHVGRVTLGLAALNIFIGIYIYHTAHGAPLATWLAPAAGLLVGCGACARGQPSQGLLRACFLVIHAHPTPGRSG